VWHVRCGVTASRGAAVNRPPTATVDAASFAEAVLRAYLRRERNEKRRQERGCALPLPGLRWPRAYCLVQGRSVPEVRDRADGLWPRP
jgi:hypothetical protein